MPTTTGTNKKLCGAPGCERVAIRPNNGLPLCGMHDQRLRKHGSFDLPPRSRPTYRECTVDGCDRDATRVSWGLCEKHHARVRRHGSTDRLDTFKPGAREHDGGGYLLDYAPDHPLRVGASPRVYQHRIVYFDHHGEGPFSCYHCGSKQTWDTMHVDHLDDNPKNNEISNLVCSCPICNQRRGIWKIKRTMQENSGWMIEYKGERLHVSEWADRLGITSESLKNRIKNWPMDRAMTEPRGKTGPRANNRRAGD